MTVTPINPKGGSIEGVNAASRLSDMVTSETAGACAVSIITPPAVTTTIVQEAYSAGITRIWMQPGSESPEAVSFGKEHNMTVVHDYCIQTLHDQETALLTTHNDCIHILQLLSTAKAT